MFLSSAIITVHLENLRHNLKTLLARHPSLMPVIKANAYGHGVVAVARVLAEEGIQHMAIATVGEGALLRQEGHTAFPARPDRDWQGMKIRLLPRATTSRRWSIAGKALSGSLRKAIWRDGRSR